LARESGISLEVEYCQTKGYVLVEEVAYLFPIRKNILVLALEELNSLSGTHPQAMNVFLLVTYHLSDPFVAPVAMYNKKPLKKPKLGYSKVTGHNSLCEL
jgi:hypothetical protein